MDANPSSTNLTQTRILIVDDHPGMAATLGRALAQLGPGIQVISATGGQEALEQVKDLPVDMLITDMMMPEMNGMELIEKLRAHPAGQPFFTVLMTAYDVPGLRESARRLKINEMIIKPFPPERMRSIVQLALERMNQSRSGQAPAVNRQPFKILIADDLEDNVSLLSRYLQNEGFNYITAASGKEALEKIRAEMPDLILLDVNMPQKDGFAVLQELRQDPAIEHIPVIILTAARLDPMDVQTGLNLGADDYMTKPFDRRELLARIRTKLRARDSEEAIRRRRREFSVLPEIGREFSARHDLDELAAIIVRRTVETLGAERGHVFLFTGHQAHLHREYCIAPTAGKADGSMPAVEELVAQIRDPQQGLIVADAQADPFWSRLTDGTCNSLLVVPLLGRMEPVGLLILAHEKSGYFNTDHLLLLRAIASQAAIGIEGLLANPIIQSGSVLDTAGHVRS
jgi:CheY-like chemotaxis protein